MAVAVTCYAIRCHDTPLLLLMVDTRLQYAIAIVITPLMLARCYAIAATYAATPAGDRAIR